MVEKVLQLNKEKAAFWALVSVLVLFVGFYMFFVRTTINNVVARQNLESEASTLSLEIGSKEFEYITKRNAVTLTLAYSMGFKDSQEKTFIARNPSTKVAYLSN
ncbi:MAG: hypothetical protein QG579_601 [Patescibacteria group bacterium]|jgi:hypothetical protein|nr:hypothetical protein [Patescibacteria group bacterium]